MSIVNGKDFVGDVGRMIRKFDIYVCDLGDVIEGGLLGKCRPCVIVQSFNTNDPRSCKYIIAPIRTEHSVTVTRDNLDDIIRLKRSIGKIYVPIEMELDDFRFIDITEMRCIPHKQIQWLKGSIVNTELQSRINRAMLELLFFPEELGMKPQPEIEIPQVIEKVEVNYNDIIENDEDDIEEEYEKVEEFKEEEKSRKLAKGYTGNKTKLPTGFSVYYELHKQKKMTKVEIAKKLNKSYGTVDRYFKIYEIRKEQLT